MKKSLLLLSAALLVAACTENKDNNKTLEFDKLDVNFSVKTSGIELPEGAVFAVSGSCTRGNEEDFQLGGNAVLSYRTLKAGDASEMVPCSEEDRIESLKNDHNFRFYALYPYAESFDPAAIPFKVPAAQNYLSEPTEYCCQAAMLRTTTVIPTLTFKTMNPVALLNFSIPIDIVSAGEASRLKSLTLKAKNADALTESLAGEGTINLDEDAVNISETGASKTITYTFQDGGLELKGQTTVTLAVLPFTIPDGGMILTVEDVSGVRKDCTFWTTSADKGKLVEGGSMNNITVTSDGIIPVNFPVIFPLGTIDGVKQFTSQTQPRWGSQQYIFAPDQPSAYAIWTVAERAADYPCPDLPIKYEYVSSGSLATPGIKGAWTGDGFEFNLPVKKLDAGSKINVKFPMYGRQHPAFWYIKYLDGGNWKIHNPQTLTYGDVSMECTFTAAYGGTTIDQTLTFENEIKNDYVKIRIEVADGRYQIPSANTIAVREAPNGGDKGSWSIAFYFSNAADPTLPFSFTLAE